MGQKIEEILRLCKKLFRDSKYLPNDENTANRNGKSEGNGNSGSEPAVRMSPNKGQQDDRGKKNGFWYQWTLQDRVQLSLAVCTAAAVISGVWANIQTRSLVKTAQDTYSAVDRPYVGVNSDSISFINVGKDGKVEILKEPDANVANGFAFDFELKNYGSVPALEFLAHYNGSIDGKLQENQTTKHGPTQIFPGGTVHLRGQIGSQTYGDLVAGKSVLDIDIHASYEYAQKTYTYCERREYVPKAGAFMNLGAMCEQP